MLVESPLVMTYEKAAGILVRSLTPNRPYHAQWMITRKCNYRCKGCTVWREQDMRELSTEEVKKGLDALKDLGVLEIVFSGGNPLLREDMGEIINYASRFFITTIYDNGSMAAEKKEVLRKADFVAISIDSLDPEKNDYIKGVNGALKKSLHAVEILQQEGIGVCVTPTISQMNLYEMLDLTTYFLQKEIPLWYCLYSHDRPYDSEQLFRIGKQNDEFLITDKSAIVNLCDSLVSMKKENSKILMTKKILEAIKNLYLQEKRTWKCCALQNFLIVDHLGRVAGCHLHKPVATIFDLNSVWNSDKFEELRRVYNNCNQCTYLCYIFYSLYGNVRGNLQIAKERWKNVKFFIDRSKRVTSEQ